MMLKRAALALVLLSACTPEGAPPESAGSETVAPETPVAPAATASMAGLDPTKYKAAGDGEVTVTTPVAGARISSPLVAEGQAINTWFFEGQFVAELLVNGEAITQAPAMQAGDTNWTDPGPVNFRAEMNFSVPVETNAELVLSEDMPEFLDPNSGSDERGPARSVRIPVILLPAAQ